MAYGTTFSEFPKTKGQACELYTKALPFQCLVEWLAFQKFNSFNNVYFGPKLSQQISVPLALYKNVMDILVL